MELRCGLHLHGTRESDVRLSEGLLKTNKAVTMARNRCGTTQNVTYFKNGECKEQLSLHQVCHESIRLVEMF
jgi:hypothetical protein